MGVRRDMRVEDGGVGMGGGVWVWRREMWEEGGPTTTHHVCDCHL